MSSIINKKQAAFFLKVGIAYTLFWIIVDLFTQTKNFFPFALNEVWRAIYIVSVNYFFFEYTIKKVSRKRILFSIVLIIFQFLLFSLALFGWRELGIVLHIHTSFITYKNVGHGMADQFGASLFSLVFFGTIRHIYNYIKLKASAQQLLIEKQRAELNYLKSQTNPHFLFNTLNNIYSLSRDKSDLAPESILRLSKILRYMLYETSGSHIAVEQELKIMSDYIALEQLRYDETLRVNFSHDVEDMKQSLPPLLLIPLVENAFKHGVSETRGRPFVDIHLSINKRQLLFTVKNSTEQSQGGAGVHENIGLSNLRRQLELLYKDYDLNVKQDVNEFVAVLKINLASHV